jgi:hypothetical protein
LGIVRHVSDYTDAKPQTHVRFYYIGISSGENNIRLESCAAKRVI